MASKAARQAAIRKASEMVRNDKTGFLSRAGEEDKMADFFEKWFNGLSRAQQLSLAEVVHRSTSGPFSEPSPVIGWIDQANYETEEKQQTEEPLEKVSRGTALSGVEYPADATPLGTQTGRLDCSKPNCSIVPKPTMNLAKLEESVRLFFEGIGDDPNRDGIKDTPARVAKVWAETMNGYTLKPEDFVTLFDNDAKYDGPVILRNAEFYTKCEHHLEPFSGTLDIAYWPGEKIIGLSKLLRIARVFCKRPQNQERLTMQIANALDEQLSPKGVAVRIKAEHHCMISRGVRIKGAVTETETFRGTIYPVWDVPS